MTDNRMTIQSIGQVAIRVEDLDRAIKFYKDVLKLDFLFRAGELAFFQCGEVRLMLSEPEGKEFDHPASVLYYKVDDLEGAYGRLKANDADATDEPHLIARMEDHDLWMAFFKDSEGNTFALMSEKKR